MRLETAMAGPRGADTAPTKLNAVPQDFAQWQGLVGAIPEPVAVLDDENRFVAVNETFARLLGMDPLALLDQRAGAVLPMAKVAAITGGERDTPAAGRTGASVGPWLTGDEGRLWRVSRSRVDGPHGRPLLMVYACEITDAALTGKAFAAQQDLAAVGSLTALFAHGANNRLTVILSCLDMIGMAGMPAEDTGKAVELANGAARRLAGDMSALLAGARRQVAQPEVVQLRESVRRASNTFKQLPGAELQVLAEVADGLDVLVDPDRVEAAILRVLSFARRRGACAVTLTGEEILIESRPSKRPMLRKGRYGRLDAELVGATLSERLLRIDPEPGHVTDRLLDPDGLELAAVESFVIGLRGQLEMIADSGANPRIRLYLPLVAAT